MAIVVVALWQPELAQVWPSAVEPVYAAGAPVGFEFSWLKPIKKHLKLKKSVWKFSSYF